MEENRRFKWVFICSPLKGNTETNTRKALMYCQYAIVSGKLPICSHIYFTQFANESNPILRAISMGYGLDLMLLCHELWVCGAHISDRMKTEIERAKKYGIPVHHLLEKDTEHTLKTMKGFFDNVHCV